MSPLPNAPTLACEPSRPEADAERHPGGRPFKANRENQIQCVALLLARALGGKQAAKAFKVGRATVYRWRDRLLKDGEQDTEALRRLAERGYRGPNAPRKLLSPTVGDPGGSTTGAPARARRTRPCLTNGMGGS